MKICNFNCIYFALLFVLYLREKLGRSYRNNNVFLLFYLLYTIQQLGKKNSFLYWGFMLKLCLEISIVHFIVSLLLYVE